MHRAQKMLLAACASLVGLTGTAQAAEVDVTPTSLNGWQVRQSGGSTLQFENGPAAPPCGTGSAEFRVDATGATAAQLRNPNYQGVKLADLTALSYSTYVEQNAGGLNNNEQAVYIILGADLDGNLATTGDRTLLFFEPVYQDVTFFPSNPQGDVVLGVWQDWDALNGGWWSTTGAAGATPGTGVKSLSDIIDAFPNATLVNAGNGDGGVRLVAGFGGPADWGSFIGNADCFTLGVNSASTTYDFEAAATTNAQIDGSDTGVPNRVVGPGGLTLQDLVDECAADAGNHGEFVSCVARLANDLRKAGLLSNKESADLKKAAAQSSVGKS